MGGGNIQLFEKSDTPGQKLDIKSSDVVLAPSVANAVAGDKGDNTYQMFTPHFQSVGYDLGIHPGFPGELVACGGQYCLSSAKDKSLAKVIYLDLLPFVNAVSILNPCFSFRRVS